MENTANLRKKYIDGLKGTACIFIMLGHYCGIYKYAQDASAIDCKFISAITSFPLSFFTSESFWLYLFFIISGYLLAISHPPKNGFMFIRKCLVRFFRLALPILGASVFILIIQFIIGFHTQEVENFVLNKWLQNYYQQILSVFDLLKEPFYVLIRGTSKFNSPYWVLKDMFLASIVIYGLCWIKQIVTTKWELGGGIGIVAIVTFFALKKIIIVACVLGMIIGWYEKRLAQVIKKNNLWIGIDIVILFSSFVLNNVYLYSIAFAVFLTSISQVFILNKLFSSNIMVWFGKLSFGIYSLHWPVFNSFGMLILIKIYGKVDNNLVLILMFLFSIIITLILALIYNITIEKWTAYFCGYLNRRIVGINLEYNDKD